MKRIITFLLLILSFTLTSCENISKNKPEKDYIISELKEIIENDNNTSITVRNNYKSNRYQNIPYNLFKNSNLFEDFRKGRINILSDKSTVNLDFYGYAIEFKQKNKIIATIYFSNIKTENSYDAILVYKNNYYKIYQDGFFTRSIGNIRNFYTSSSKTDFICENQVYYVLNLNQAYRLGYLTRQELQEISKCSFGAEVTNHISKRHINIFASLYAKENNIDSSDVIINEFGHFNKCDVAKVSIIGEGYYDVYIEKTIDGVKINASGAPIVVLVKVDKEYINLKEAINNNELLKEFYNQNPELINEIDKRIEVYDADEISIGTFEDILYEIKNNKNLTTEQLQEVNTLLEILKNLKENKDFDIADLLK